MLLRSGMKLISGHCIRTEPRGRDRHGAEERAMGLVGLFVGLEEVGESELRFLGWKLSWLGLFGPAR